MITILSGGTGTPKLLQGFSDREDLNIIVNVAEDMEQSGGYVSPDMDTVLYTLAGIVDEKRWYGIRGDTYATHERMTLLGYRELLKIGDLDRGTKIARKVMLDAGISLVTVTAKLCVALGIKANVFPASNERITTFIETDSGKKRFHEFWVRDGGKEEVRRVWFGGIGNATAPREALELCQKSKSILIGPSNPITSISPITGIGEWASMLSKKKVIAVSPFLGKKVFSGPATNLMRGCGFEASPFGTACVYKDFLNMIVIDDSDTSFKKAIEDMGIEVVHTNIVMNSSEEKKMLASYLEEIL